MSSKQLIESMSVLDAVGGLLPSLMKLLSNTDSQIGNLVVELIQTVIKANNATTKKQQKSVGIDPAFVMPLMDLLNDSNMDITSSAVISMLAQFVVDEFPGTVILDTIFNNLDKGEDAIQRAKSLSILSEIFRIQFNFAQGGNTEERSKEKYHLSLRMARELMFRLGDEKLHLRVEAGKLFAHLEPSFIIPQLVPQLYSSNVKVRSAASNSLQYLLLHHPNILGTFMNFMEALIGFSNSVDSQPPFKGQQTPQTLIHLGDRAGGERRSSFDYDRAIMLIPKWAEEIEKIAGSSVTSSKLTSSPRATENSTPNRLNPNPTPTPNADNFWRQLIRSYFPLTFAHPSHMVFVQSTVKLSPWISRFPDEIIPIFISKLKSQQSLSEEMVFEDGNNEKVTSLLYELLGPLLSLRTLTDQIFIVLEKDVDSEKFEQFLTFCTPEWSAPSNLMR
eukprot:TRINITY_DN2656_c1_g1_i1.p1 TRINITY_DN2656_c1_g1~~TRINITY_DN2656_c1_g1_i1.p1  ORF type:complete len:447 (-),score=109.87 TRINITY_DN2656_c1_g1_i1:556-1896(-)